MPISLHQLHHGSSCLSHPFVLILCISFAIPCCSSPGDQSIFYRKCMRFCGIQNCSNTTNLAHFQHAQPWYMSILSWDCIDECQYSCMWYTVRVHEVKGYPVPQFHGKWPFVRFYGIQEPASVLFSILNGFSHVYMWLEFKKKVPKAHRYVLWDFQAVLSINAFFWSAVFHTRDTPLTEKMDYFCAFSLILYSLYCVLVKLFSDKQWSKSFLMPVPFLSFFSYHIYYLTYVQFDYGYNLKANVIVGLLNSVGWLFWCYRNSRKPYMWKCAISVLVINVLLLLELGDFPPWGYFIDAHALWHLSTIPVPILWYRFLIDDSLYLKQKN